MIAWGRLALAFAQGLVALLTYLREHQLIQAGEEQALAKVLQGELNAIKKATEAREQARLRNDAVPKSDSLPDDGFRRD